MTPTFNSKNKRPWLTENHKRLSDWEIGKETIEIQYGQMKSCMNITSNIVKPLNREKITKELKQTT